MKAIVLVDHGSRAPAANAVLDQVAAMLRKRLGSRALVAAAHMELCPPTLSEAFAQVVAQGATELIVHPYFLALGRHASEDIPRLAAEAAACHPGVSFRVTEPLGVHELLAELVLLRVGLGS